MEILKRAHGRENDTRLKNVRVAGWQAQFLGAKLEDIKRLVDGGFIEYVIKEPGYSTFHLTKKGQGLVAMEMMELAHARVPAETILEAMHLVFGYGDLKQAIAHGVERQSRTHFMLEGPPACAKSVILDGVRRAVPGAFPAFGSRTSAAGLSDVLFEHRPGVLLLDEADKMDGAVFAVLLGLMETGEVLETKSRRSRGIQLNTTVLAACNSSRKMPAEFLSRFSLHAVFPPYTREEFIAVCRGMLVPEGCPEEIAGTIGQWVYDYGLGDVRKARGVWHLMDEPSEEEVRRVVNLMLHYGGNGQTPARRDVAPTARMKGM
jgi:hypothetical protein